METGQDLELCAPKAPLLEGTKALAQLPRALPTLNREVWGEGRDARVRALIRSMTVGGLGPMPKGIQGVGRRNVTRGQGEVPTLGG